MNTYKVWMSATSTINTTLEVEAQDEQDALEKARDYAIENSRNAASDLSWYYEGSGDVELDDECCWKADLVPPPPPYKSPTERMAELIGSHPFTVVAEKRYYRLFAGTEDVTFTVANFMGLKTQMSAGKYKCDAVMMNPTTCANEVLTNLCSKIGREVGPVTVL